MTVARKQRPRLNRRAWSVLPDAEFYRRQRRALKTGDWSPLDNVRLWCSAEGFLPISSYPYRGRFFVERRQT